MHIIRPSATLWQQPDDPNRHVQRAAIVCYGRNESRRDPALTCADLIAHGHRSMFRHATHYYLWVHRDPFRKAPVSSVTYFKLLNSEYCSVSHDPKHFEDGQPSTVNPKADKHNATGIYLAVLNGQYLLDHPDIATELAPYSVSLECYIAHAVACSMRDALLAIRFTVACETQISTSRELNRTSPNAIAEQSTRYVNFGHRGGITICEPHWYQYASPIRRFFSRLKWRIDEFFYGHTFPPQDARGFLSLDTATRAIYTYSLREWSHILDLRLNGTTGDPHPNARILSHHILHQLEDGIDLTIRHHDSTFIYYEVSDKAVGRLKQLLRDEYQPPRSTTAAPPQSVTFNNEYQLITDQHSTRPAAGHPDP